MTAENYKQEQDFIISIISDFNLDEVNGIRAGAVVFDSSTQAVSLNPFKNFFQLAAAIRSLTHEQGGTFTHLGISVVRDIFRREGRPNVPQIVVIMTDGRSKNGTATREQAALAKEEGIRVITIGIGTQIDTSELFTIASSPELFLRVDNFNALKDLTLDIAKEVCPSKSVVKTKSQKRACFHFFC